MKVLIVHNSYQQKGGEDSVVAAEGRLLRTNGIETRNLVRSNHQIRGFSKKVRTFARTSFDPNVIPWVKDEIRQYNPDIVHVHNFFPLITPAIHQAATESGTCVIQTLHNYRIACSNGLFLRSGVPCEKCLSGSPYWSVVHKCYRGSRIGSLAVARMIDRARARDHWNRNVQRFIALSEFAKSRYISAGIEPDRISIKPNFCEVPEIAAKPERRSRNFLYVGRISKEKGVDILIEAFRDAPKHKLSVIGDGPLLSDLQKRAPDNVSFLGFLESENVYLEMHKAKALIMPSVYYEGFPVTLVEALACYLPVIASEIGSLAEIVQHNVTGYLIQPGDKSSILAALDTCERDQDQLTKMRYAARQSYLDNYSEQTNFVRLMAIYESALDEFGRDAASSAPVYY